MTLIEALSPCSASNPATQNQSTSLPPFKSFSVRWSSSLPEAMPSTRSHPEHEAANLNLEAVVISFAAVAVAIIVLFVDLLFSF